MELKNLDRKPTAFEVIPEVHSTSPIEVDTEGTVSIPAFTGLNVAEAKEVAMSVLFAAALAQLEKTNV